MALPPTPAHAPPPILSIKKYCLWLHSANKTASDQAFSLYYNAIAPRLRSFLRHQFWMREASDVITAADDALQEVFLRVNQRLQDMPRHRARIAELKVLLHRGAQDTPHDREVHRWRLSAHSWGETLGQFCPRTCPRAIEEDCESTAHTLNARCELIQVEGARLALALPGALFLGLAEADEGPEDGEEDWLELEEPEEPEPPPLQERGNPRRQGIYALRRQLRSLLKPPEGSEAPRFAMEMDELLTSLSALRLPLLPLYYQIARHLVNDWSRKFRWQKEVSLSRDEEDDPEENNPHRRESWLADHSEVGQRQQWDFWRDVQRLLADRQQQAESAWALSAGKTLRERRRAQAHWEKEQALLVQYRMIIERIMVGEVTQEQLASSLGMTRDQLRYRLEGLQSILHPLRGEMR